MNGLGRWLRALPARLTEGGLVELAKWGLGGTLGGAMIFAPGSGFALVTGFALLLIVGVAIVAVVVARRRKAALARQILRRRMVSITRERERRIEFSPTFGKRPFLGFLLCMTARDRTTIIEADEALEREYPCRTLEGAEKEPKADWPAWEHPPQ